MAEFEQEINVVIILVIHLVVLVLQISHDFTWLQFLLWFIVPS